jgi:dolichol-phosphate mannosyltransferase
MLQRSHEERTDAGHVEPPQGVRGTALQLLSVVIPARDEEECLASTIEHLHLELRLRQIPHEIIVVDDGSSDGTWQVLQTINRETREVVPLQNDGPNGFGHAVIRGLDRL